MKEKNNNTFRFWTFEVSSCGSRSSPFVLMAFMWLSSHQSNVCDDLPVFLFVLFWYTSNNGCIIREPDSRQCCVWVRYPQRAHKRPYILWSVCSWRSMQPGGTVLLLLLAFPRAVLAVLCQLEKKTWSPQCSQCSPGVRVICAVGTSIAIPGWREVKMH